SPPLSYRSVEAAARQDCCKCPPIPGRDRAQLEALRRPPALFPDVKAGLRSLRTRQVPLAPIRARAPIRPPRAPAGQSRSASSQAGKNVANRQADARTIVHRRQWPSAGFRPAGKLQPAQSRTLSATASNARWSLQGRRVPDRGSRRSLPARPPDRVRSPRFPQAWWDSKAILFRDRAEYCHHVSQQAVLPILPIRPICPISLDQPLDVFV